jgi:hypothetical protein
VLTTSFITPTAMGVALLVPTDLPEGKRINFEDEQNRLACYEVRLFQQQMKKREDGTDPCQKVK